MSIFLPKVRNNLQGTEFTFTINQLKCDVGGIAVVYYKLHLTNLNNEAILSNSDAFHIGERAVVDEDWGSYHDTFTIVQNILNTIKYYQIELRFVLVDNDNPIYFSELMLQNGTFETYHSTNETMEEAEIGFINNSYANLYDGEEEDYLQIIRADRVPFTTTSLSKAENTVLVPHLVGEPPLDKPENVFMEYLHQTEQTTNIKMI